MSEQPLLVPDPAYNNRDLMSTDATRTRTAAYDHDSNVIGDAEVHLIDYVKVLYKRRWTALTPFLIVFLSVALYTLTATPMYESRVQILIEKEASNVVTFKEAIEQNQVTDDYYQTQYKILQSRALARRTINALKLWNHPQFSPVSTDSKIFGIPAVVSGWTAMQNLSIRRVSTKQSSSRARSAAA